MPAEDLPALPVDSILSDWMGQMAPVLDPLPLLALSLPGTHDTLTYELSTVLSDGEVPDALREYERFDGINDFIRWQAQTHALDISSQLENGIRFFDFRMMYESDLGDWYSEHTIQSKRTTVHYLTEMRSWLDAHSSEIIVLWLSKHGNTCNKGDDQYTNVSTEEKQNMWQRIQEIFDGLLVDFSVTSINSTSLADMKQRGHRVVIYAADYEEMTSNSSLALDACLIDNILGTQAYKDDGAWLRETFNSSQERIASDMLEQRLMLVSMAGSAGNQQIAAAAVNRFAGTSIPCPMALSPLPNFTTWCPETLLDLAQLENYYGQRELEWAVVGGYGLPNAIYINGVDWDGTIRTGTKMPYGTPRSPDPDHQISRYAYVATFLSWNYQLACRSVDCSNQGDLAGRIEAQRAKYPLGSWDDEPYGRSRIEEAAGATRV